MRRIVTIALAVFAAASPVAAAESSPLRANAIEPARRCATEGQGLGVERVVEIDTSGGPLFGAITKQEKEGTFLKPKEVVLTFDDGPMPWITRSILDSLDAFCTKATFFSVGRMALAYPRTLRDVVGRGHTVGGHTWSHPLNLKRLKLEKAVDEIERGLAAISIASGGRAAPFFRFPGLSDNNALLASLQKRGIASFSVDVVSDDSYISDPARLVRVTLERVEARRGGILLFHDIKTATAKALPIILAELKKRGYKVVHMRSKELLKPLPGMAEELQPLLAKNDPPVGQSAQRAAMLPFYGALGPEARPRSQEGETDGGARDVALAEISVEQVAPPPRERVVENPSEQAASRKRKAASHSQLRTVTQPELGGWTTNINRSRLSRPVYD